MINILRRVFIKNYTNVNDIKVREAHGKLAGFVGIISNLFLFIIKMLAGIISSSIAIIADSINNLSDMGSSIITLIGFKLAGAPADEDHPYGHQRIEYVAGLIVSIIIIVVGGNLLISSIEKIINYEYVEIQKSYIYISIGILSVSILIKFWQSFFNRKIGKLINSVALEATSKDSLNDCISTFTLLIGNIVLLFYQQIPFSLDGCLGILVSLFIIVSGIKLIKETVNPLIGVPVEKEFIDNIIKEIKKEPLVLGIQDPVCHMYGPTKCFMTIHVEIDANKKMLEVHDAIDNLEKRILEKFGVELTIHMDPIEIDNPKINQLRQLVKDCVREIDVNLSMHDFRVVSGPTHINIIFDLVRPYKYKLSDQEILALLQEKIKIDDTKFYLVINFENEYTKNSVSEEY